MALTSGSKLGPYEILAPLGAGGMGRCIEFETTDWGGTVGMLNHPNILSI
jgi:hypothetical protein